MMNDNLLSGRTVAVIGLGLLGTSLAMAARQLPVRLTGWTRRREIRDWAVAENILDDAAAEPDDLLSRADLTILCLPVPAIIEFGRAHAGHFRPGAAVTDIGSVKGVIVAALEPLLAAHGSRFIGSHPMAGTEKSGPSAAFPTLYAHAEVFVTPTAQSHPEALTLVEQFWQAIGTTTHRIAPEAHDILVAHTSHISHLLAMALTHAVLGCPDAAEKEQRFSGCATGFRDTSRIASSSPAMWREIIEDNRPAVLNSMDSFERYWRELRKMIEQGDFDRFESEFAKSKTMRDAWIKYKNDNYNCNW